MSGIAKPFINATGTATAYEPVAADLTARFCKAEVMAGPNTEIWFFYKDAPFDVTAKIIWRYATSGARDTEYIKVLNTLSAVVA